LCIWHNSHIAILVWCFSSSYPIIIIEFVFQSNPLIQNNCATPSAISSWTKQMAGIPNTKANCTQLQATSAGGVWSPDPRMYTLFMDKYTVSTI
jgi:hypothetical protein